MYNTIQCGLLYTNDEMNEILSYSDCIICTNNQRTIFAQKNNPILDIREMRYQYYKWEKDIEDSYYFISCDLYFVKPNKAKIRFKKYNPEEICI